jgi:hypothetical protein
VYLRKCWHFPTLKRVGMAKLARKDVGKKRECQGNELTLTCRRDMLPTCHQHSQLRGVGDYIGGTAALLAPSHQDPAEGENTMGATRAAANSQQNHTRDGQVNINLWHLKEVRDISITTHGLYSRDFP